MTRSLNRPLLLILLLYGPLLTNSWWFFDNEDSLSKKVEELTQEEVTGTPIEESDDSDDYSTSRRLKFGIKEHRFNSSLVVDEDNEVDDEEGNVEHNDEEVPKLDPVPENIYTTTENVPELPTPLPDNGEESPEEPESTTEALVIPADISDTDLSADDKQHATESAEAEVTTTVIPTSTVEVTEVPAHPEATEPTTESSVEATEPTTKSHSDVTDSDVTVVDIESHEGDLIPKEDATTVKTETDFQNEADVTEKQIEDSTTTLPEFRATPEVEGDQEQSQEGQEAEQFQATTTSLDQIEETEATESPEAPEVTETTHDKRTTGSALEEDTSTVEPQQTTLTLADQPLLETTTMAPIVQPANEESERTDEVAESTTIYPEATKSARDENNINVGNEEERNEYTTIDPVGRANEGEGFETTPEDVAFSPPTADSNDILQNIEIDTPDKENQVVYITNIDDLPTSTVLRGRRPPAEVTPPTNQVQERQETEAPQRPYKRK
ncbi:unnamed protein product [Bursaphelenchus okinawaensis]|uniref:Uncharacterized protein n=1 Tax=Bursaphelenchus okinawaensis TaxID=465554 RepID=A0A811KAD5_9BILA|nr:unnamed protein product [Bursaphelenchus okinawaensis]CAG9097357.1 unnamed protein product [Bursaphelenchus okinawaensis]